VAREPGGGATDRYAADQRNNIILQTALYVLPAICTVHNDEVWQVVEKASGERKTSHFST
jgi:hypothetical protein